MQNTPGKVWATKQCALDFDCIFANSVAVLAMWLTGLYSGRGGKVIESIYARRCPTRSSTSPPTRDEFPSDCGIRPLWKDYEEEWQGRNALRHLCQNKKALVEVKGAFPSQGKGIKEVG